MATRRRSATPKGRGGQSGFGNPRNNPATPEQQHDDAVRVLRAEYYGGGVLSIVEDLIARIKDGEIKDQEDFERAMDESIDGSYWVIYTHANHQVIFCSDNHDAYMEEVGDAPVSDGDINWAALAYYAMRRDVQERFDAEGVEIGGSLEESRRRRPVRRGPPTPHPRARVRRRR